MYFQNKRAIGEYSPKQRGGQVMKKMIRRIVAMFAVTMIMTTTIAVDAFAAGANGNLNLTAYAHSSRWNFYTDVDALIQGEGIIYGMVGAADADPESEARGENVCANICTRKEDVCVYFRAEAKEGWRFVHWLDAKTGEVYSADPVLEFKPGSKNHLIALFTQ